MSRFAIKAPAPAGPKKFAWSYSKLKNFENCPQKHFRVDLEKSIVEPESPQLKEGNAVHKALADAVIGKTPLPPEYAKYQKWVDKTRLVAPHIQILVEQQLAISDSYLPETWFSKNTWLRVIIDALLIVKTPSGTVAIARDWKTGKPIEDSVQLALSAAAIFAHHPEVEKVGTEFVWLADGFSTPETFTRMDMVELWTAVLPRVQLMVEAHETGHYPPKPGALCKRWCPVDTCAHHGG